jgi:hypothetical protein
LRRRRGTGIYAATWKSLASDLAAECVPLIKNRVRKRLNAKSWDGGRIYLTNERRRCRGANHRNRAEHRRRERCPTREGALGHASVGYQEGDNIIACLHPSVHTSRHRPDWIEVSKSPSQNQKVCQCLDHVFSSASTSLTWRDFKNKVCCCQGLCDDFRRGELECPHSGRRRHGAVCEASFVEQELNTSEQAMMRASSEQAEDENNERATLDSATQEKCS